MTIKSDNWIRRMSAAGMIEPFEPGQVRSVDGRKIVSYGTSSYGYDVRCANEFKIFTNINSTIVDPKAFDPQSFVDLTADVCIIPPNSFALARTVEYFRIPRSVLTVCLGKSTYARCFRGDTRVALVDGSAPTLEEMARRADLGETFLGYSIDGRGRIVVSRLVAPRFIGRDSLLEVRLDDDSIIHATPDHEFLRRDGSTAAAGSLRTGDALMPLYRHASPGGELVYQPPDGLRYPARLLAAEWTLRQAMPVAAPESGALHAELVGRNERPAGSVRSDRRIAIGQGREYRRAATVPVTRPAAVGRLARWPRGSRSHTRRGPVIAGAAGGGDYLNHKVAGVRSLPGDHDVYCLTVPEAGNFALAAGVFVRNCGIIVNVTPLEPEWEGHVTLEFSNTTTLPAKIYANEGVAQMLFFESDEVCSTSYKDRAGKYMGQRGVTLPKT